MQAGLGRLKPLLPQVLPSGSVSVVTSCWSIWPTFSCSVIAPSRAFTRSDIDLPESSQAGDFPASASGPGAAWDGTPTPEARDHHCAGDRRPRCVGYSRRWELIRNRRE